MVQTTHPQLTTVGERKITVNDQTIPYIIKCSARAKYVRLEVRQETGLTVVIPSPYKLKHLPVLLKSKGNWILDKLTKYEQVQSLSDKKETKSGGTIPYLGRNLEMVKRQNRRNANSIKLKRTRLELFHKKEAERKISRIQDDLLSDESVITRSEAAAKIGELRIVVEKADAEIAQLQSIAQRGFNLYPHLLRIGYYGAPEGFMSQNQHSATKAIELLIPLSSLCLVKCQANNLSY